jgi:hypothetical protein
MDLQHHRCPTHHQDTAISQNSVQISYKEAAHLIDPRQIHDKHHHTLEKADTNHFRHMQIM